jgi:hypothetical protein
MCELGHRSGRIVFIPVYRASDGCEYLEFSLASTDELEAARQALLRRVTDNRDQFLRMERFENKG